MAMSNIVIQTKLPQQLFDGCPWHLDIHVQLEMDSSNVGDPFIFHTEHSSDKKNQNILLSLLFMNKDL